MEQKITLPWPPSVNSYLAIVGRRKVKTKKARDYCREVNFTLIDQRVASFGEQRIKIEIKAYPPDNRRRDLDNILKATFDSLTTAGVYQDDSQVDFLSVERMEKVSGGKMELRISAL